MAAELEGLEGTLLAGCRLIEPLGRGGMAVVYKARIEKTGELVAVKIMRPSLDAEPEFRQRIVREAKIAARLRHPNVVRVRTIREKGGLFFLVMDYVEGESLFGHEKRRGPLSVVAAAPLMGGILDALAFAHEHRVVHRDIKPENVLVTGDGTPVLTDFGIAKSLEGTKLTKTGLALGTPLYMSPEQVRGEADVDVRSDIYSAGVLFYELLCGSVPFDGDDPVAIGYRHVHTPPVPPSDHNPALSADADRFVLKAMEKERVDRYGSAKEMRRCLDRLVAGDPVPLEIRMPLRRLPRRPPLGPLAKAVVATLVVGLLLALAVAVRDGYLEAGFFSAAPGDPLARGLAELAAGRVAEGCALLEEEAAKGQASAERRAAMAAELYDLGTAALTAGRPTAGRLLELSLDFDGDRADTCFQLAKLHMRDRRPRLAAMFFGRVLKILEPERAYEFVRENESLYFAALPKEELGQVGRDLCEVGRRLYRQGRPDQARDILRKALHYQEDLLQAHETLARIYRDGGDAERAGYHQKRYAELFAAGGE